MFYVRSYRLDLQNKQYETVSRRFSNLRDAEQFVLKRFQDDKVISMVIAKPAGESTSYGSHIRKDVVRFDRGLNGTSKRTVLI
jgi:hypothetical protein